MRDKLSGGEWKIINFLTSQNGLVNIKELADRARVSYVSLVGKSGHIFRLEDYYGFVKTSIERKIKYIKITKKGQEYVEKYKQHYNFFYNEI